MTKTSARFAASVPSAQRTGAEAASRKLQVFEYKHRTMYLASQVRATLGRGESRTTEHQDKPVVKTLSVSYIRDTSTHFRVLERGALPSLHTRFRAI